MNLAEVSIKRPVAISMVVVGILLLGFVSLEKIPLNLLPDITYPKITIQTEYPHAAPREVEERVTKFIESSVGIINNVVKVSSVSRPGWSDVYVEFRWGSDIDVIAMDIREKIQLLENFLPEEVERPILLRYDPNQDPIITLAVSGDMDLSDLRRWVEMNFELELERIDGVAAVKVEGGYEDEIVVELDEEKLASYGLRMSTISDRLERENVNIAGGSLEESGHKLAVRTVNRFTGLDDIKQVIVAERGSSSTETSTQSKVSSPMAGIPSGGGMGGMGSLGGLLSGISSAVSTGAVSGKTTGSQAVIRLKDIARVSYQKKDRTEIARLNGRECIKVSIFKEGDANIVGVARSINQAVAEIKDNHREAVRSPEWEKKLKSPRRKLEKAVNLLSNLLLNYKPHVIEDEPIKLEHDVKIETISDQSVFITQSIYSVAQTAIWGSLIAVLVLYVFLRNISSTLIVGLAIPISIITTFNLMFFNDITFNIMSLGGLALGVGMLVDNSIVVLENILRRRTFEPSPRISGERGAREVSSAITASTLTNIMVFFPILYLEGMFRQIFGDLAYTVAFSLICSEVVALSIVPMLTVVFGKTVRLPDELLDDLDLPPEVREQREREAAKQAKEEEQAIKSDDEDAWFWKDRSPLRFGDYRAYRENRALEAGQNTGLVFRITTLIFYLSFLMPLIPAFILSRIGKGVAWVAGLIMKYPLAVFDLGFKRLKRWYPDLLRSLLKRPYAVSIGATALAFLSAGILYHLGWELLPTVDQGEFRINVEFPTGTPIDQSNRRISNMEKKISAIDPHFDFITSLFATVGIGTAEGEGTSEKAENIGEIHVAIKDRTRRDISDEEVIGRAMNAIGSEVDVTATSSKPQLLSYKTPVEIEIEGYELGQLRFAADQVVKGIRNIPGLLEIESSMAEHNPEINITIDRARASALGLSVTEITDVVQRKVKGEIPTRFDLPDQQIDIVVELEEQDRATLERLRRLTIPGPNGDIRLDQVASILPALGPATITRSENSRVALISANIHGRPLGDVVGDIKTRLAGVHLPPGTNWRITGQNEEMERSKNSLLLAAALAIILVYIVLAAQFESLLHPFVIMFCVPFSLVGLTIILVLTGQTINIFSLIGMMMMIGIAVNDAIVFVSTINLRRDEGMKRDEAIIEAGASRLRPILITTLTTVLGMVPMAMALGPGSELRAPMAITVIGGLTSSTIFTLAAIPCIYLLLDKILPRSYHYHKPDYLEVPPEFTEGEITITRPSPGDAGAGGTGRETEGMDPKPSGSG